MQGLELSSAYYHEAVRPILDQRFPSLTHSAGRLCSGSEVLGFDDEISQDHDWGPKFDLFIDSESLRTVKADLNAAMSEELPRTFRRYSTRLEEHNGSFYFYENGDPSRHGIAIKTASEFYTW